jgi:DHA1 family multidrug resistance protein-like MFS transporter
MPREQWKRNRIAICIAIALFYCGFTAVMPFLPIYVKQLGIQGEARIASWSGILITVGPLIAALCGPAWGRIGDRIGMKVMVERCTFAQAVHWVFFAYARNPYDLLVLRVLIGLFGGITSFSTPLLISTTPKDQISRSIGMLQSTQMVSSAAGPLLGGILADSIGIRNTCIIAAILSFASTLIIRMLFAETRGERHAGERKEQLPFRRAVAVPAFGAMAAVMFFVNFVERSFSPVVALYVLQLGTTSEHAAKAAGSIISLGLLSEAVAASFMGTQLKRRHPRPLLLWRLVGGMLVCLPMGLAWTTSQFLVLRIALGLLAGGCIVIVYSLASQVIPAETRGASFSFLASAALLGSAAGPIAAGELAWLSLRAIFFFNSVVFAALIVYCSESIKTDITKKGTAPIGGC